MRNAVGREIPDEILRATGKEPFQGSASTIISVKAT